MDLSFAWLCAMKWASVNEHPGGGGGDFHMKGAEMLVVSLRGVNFGFWSHIGCSEQNTTKLRRQSLI